jgi:hypothetical protein
VKVLCFAEISLIFISGELEDDLAVRRRNRWERAIRRSHLRIKGVCARGGAEFQVGLSQVAAMRDALIRAEEERLLRDERIVRILRVFAKLFYVHSLVTRQYLIGHAYPARSMVRG